MKIKNYKKLLSMALAFTFILACFATFAMNVSADYYYREADEKIYCDGSNALAAKLHVEDTYYVNCQCLHIYERVTYVNVATPYNLILSGLYTFFYTDGTNGGDAYEEIANVNNYPNNMYVYAKYNKTVEMVKVKHYFNYVNSVSNYSQANVNTTFVIE